MKGASLKQNLELKNYLTFADIHNPLSALVIENTKSTSKDIFNEFDGMWASSLTDSTSRGKPDIEAVDFSSRHFIKRSFRSNNKTNYF